MKKYKNFFNNLLYKNMKQLQDMDKTTGLVKVRKLHY